MKLRLTLPIPTSLNRLYINQSMFDKKTKKWIPTGKRIMSPEGKDVKKQIQMKAIYQMQGQDWSIDFTKDNFIYMDLIYYFSRRGTDADNTLKLLQDSLQGVVFINDSMVLPRVQKILFDHNSPKLEVLLHPTSYIGIFGNEEELNKFESKCLDCSRYRKGSCSILGQAKIGTIQEEVDKEFNCSEYKQKKGK